MPQRHVLKSGKHVGAHEARQAANLLAGHGIALVWHGGAAALPFAEGFLGFPNFSTLQMADFERDTLEHCANVGKRAQVLCVAVALNYLRRDRSDPEPESLADALFDFCAEMRSRTHRAGNLSHGHLRRGVAKACNVALVFGEPVGNLQSEGDGFSMDAVRAAN